MDWNPQDRRKSRRPKKAGEKSTWRNYRNQQNPESMSPMMMSHAPIGITGPPGTTTYVITCTYNRHKCK